jgi:adenylosuccinate synthase
MKWEFKKTIRVKHSNYSFSFRPDAMIRKAKTNAIVREYFLDVSIIFTEYMSLRSESVYIAHESTLNIKFLFVRKIKT